MGGGSASGLQHELAFESQRAVVTELGAALRCYELAGRPICMGFGADEVVTGGRGQVLAPWPNCLAEGRYRFDGRTGQAPVDEPVNGNAMHGLVRWLPWETEAAGEHFVRLACSLLAQPAYPFQLRLSVEYRLGPEGLTVLAAAVNPGTWRAPFGLGFHSYLHGGGLVDECRLRLDAQELLELDERRRPVGRRALAASPLAGLLSGRGPGQRLGGTALNECLTGLAVGSEGRWRVAFERPGQGAGPGGAGHEPSSPEQWVVWGEAACGYVMLYSGDKLAPGLARQGLAVEPMTCPPNALATGEGLVVLDPGERFQASWGISLARGSRGI